jgi:hypothetical protein
MTQKHPYYQRRFAYGCAQMEFDYFRSICREVFEAELARIPRGAPLQATHSFILQSFDEFTVQIWFGNHPTGRNVLDRKGRSHPVTEIGGTLLYSFGPRGDTAVVLYPAKSKVMRAREKFIIRRVGNLTCHQLRENIRCDLKDLVAYTYATALDGSPSIRERLRIGIIRFVCPMHIEGQQHRRAAQFLYQGVGFVARSGVIALLRPYGILAFIIVLAWFGFPSVADFVTKTLGLH